MDTELLSAFQKRVTECDELQTVSDLARLFSKIVRDPVSGCWLWTGSRKKPSGYGTVAISGKNRVAHRALWIALGLPLDSNLTLDHLCRTRHCVNPAHLEPVELKENIRRSWQAERQRANHNRDKTTCPRGHPYVHRGDGKRKCRICDRERTVERRATDAEFLEAERARRRRYYHESGRYEGRLPAAQRTHCPRDHEYTPENTYITAKGHRVCKTCKREKHRAWWQEHGQDWRRARKPPETPEERSERNRRAALARWAGKTQEERSATARHAARARWKSSQPW